MPKFDMNNVGGANAGTEIRWVNLDQLEEDPLNQEIYHTDGIEELAADIELNGLMQYLLVRYMPGFKFRIISGHRRYKALCLLAKKDKYRWGRLQVIVDRDADEDSIAIKLISANAVNRDMTQGEQLRQAVKLHELLTAQKEKEQLPGRVRDMVAAKLNMSSGSVGELLAIQNNLNGDWLELFEAGEISKRLAVELSKLDEEEQAGFSQKHMEGEPVTVELIQQYKAHMDVSESDTLAVMADNENSHYATEKVMADNKNDHNALGEVADVSESDTQSDELTDEEIQRIQAEHEHRVKKIQQAELERIAQKIQEKGWDSLEPCEKCTNSTQCFKCCAGCTERCNVWQPCYKQDASKDVSESDTSAELSDEENQEIQAEPACKEAEYIATLKELRKQYRGSEKDSNVGWLRELLTKRIEALGFALKCIKECQKKNPAN